MSDAYQIKDQSAVHFLTFQVIEWIDVFTRSRYSDILVESFNHCVRIKGLNVYAWCIMSNHVHCVVAAEHGNLSAIVRDFKTYTSKRILSSIIEKPESRREWMLERFKNAGVENSRNHYYQFWTQENHAVELSANEMIEQRIEYTHLNPVRAGIVKDEEDYRYSSAFKDGSLVNISEI
jgi:putative transposase